MWHVDGKQDASWMSLWIAVVVFTCGRGWTFWRRNIFGFSNSSGIGWTRCKANMAHSGGMHSIGQKIEYTNLERSKVVSNLEYSVSQFSKKFRYKYWPLLAQKSENIHCRSWSISNETTISWLFSMPLGTLKGSQISLGVDINRYHTILQSSAQWSSQVMQRNSGLLGGKGNATMNKFVFPVPSNNPNRYSAVPHLIQ